jgi:phosphoglycolate phosphatase
MALPHVFFWDIDGTLLSTQRAGAAAFDEACRQVMEVSAIDWTGVDFRGHTDRGIARRALEAHGRPADEATIDRLLACYESHLPRRLAERDGAALPGVVPVLERLRARADVLLMLLTGNTRNGARAKLERCGLLDFFRGPSGGPMPFGGFAEAGALRDAIARAALALAEQTVGAPLPGERCFVIGDTPHDVSCGKSIGARTVAVATGGYSADELGACEPWRLWPRLPEPAVLERELGLPAASV